MQYVIQKHSHRDNPVHWDLMIEAGEKLSTWRLEICPEDIKNGGAVGAIAIADHDIRFLAYQGAVNKGLGKVEIADKGICEILSRTVDQMTISFFGQILKGEFVFRAF